MSKEIIKEAESKEELIARLEQAQKVYAFRKEELEDEELWGAMSKGVKKTYLTILKDLEDTISKLQRRLARIEAGQPESEELSMSEGIVGDTLPEALPVGTIEIITKEEPPIIEVPKEFDIENEIIANTAPPEQEPIAPEANPEEPTLQDLIDGIENLLTKFKGSMISDGRFIKPEVEKEINLIKLDQEEVASGSPIVAIPPTSSEEGQTILKGNLEEVEEPLDFTNSKVERIIYENWPFVSEVLGETVVRVKTANGDRNFIIDYEQPNFLEVRSKDIQDKTSESIAKHIKEEIIYQLKLM